MPPTQPHKNATLFLIFDFSFFLKNYYRGTDVFLQFLTVGAAGLVAFVNSASFTPNQTFFLPNTAAALATFTNISTGLSADEVRTIEEFIPPRHIKSNAPSSCDICV